MATTGGGASSSRSSMNVVVGPRGPGSADERGLASAFEAHGLAALAAVGAAFGRLQRGEAAEATAFAPLMIRGPTAW